MAELVDAADLKSASYLDCWFKSNKGYWFFLTIPPFMSQSDTSIFFTVVRSLFFFSAFGFGTCLVHLFYQKVSSIKIIYNFFGKLVKIEKNLSLLIRGQ